MSEEWEWIRIGKNEHSSFVVKIVIVLSKITFFMNTFVPQIFLFFVCSHSKIGNSKTLVDGWRWWCCNNESQFQIREFSQIHFWAQTFDTIRYLIQKLLERLNFCRLQDRTHSNSNSTSSSRIQLTTEGSRRGVEFYVKIMKIFHSNSRNEKCTKSSKFSNTNWALKSDRKRKKRGNLKYSILDSASSLFRLAPRANAIHSIVSLKLKNKINHRIFHSMLSFYTPYSHSF